jgi:hypothetical protein
MHHPETRASHKQESWHHESIKMTVRLSLICVMKPKYPAKARWLPSCSTVNSTIGTTDRPTRIKTLSRGSRVQASPKHQQSPSLYRYDLLAMVCRWHTHVLVGCHLRTLQANFYSSMFWVWWMKSTNKVRVCTAMTYSPWYVDGTHMWLGAIYVPCRQTFTPVCFEFDEWAKLVASYTVV